MVMLSACVTLAPSASVTWTVNLEVPRIVGVPVISAEVAGAGRQETLSQAGRLPEITPGECPSRARGVDKCVIRNTQSSRRKRGRGDGTALRST